MIDWDFYPAHLRTFAETAPGVVWIAQPDGYCLYLNSRWFDLTGQQPGEEQGYGWSAKVHPDDLAHLRQAFQNASQTCQPYQEEYRVRRADGKFVWLLSSAKPCFSPNGDYLGYIGLDVAKPDHASPAPARLTSRERSVLAEIAKGKTATEIAAVLNMSPRTVEHHLRAAGEKLGGRNRVETIVAAIRSGELPLTDF